MISELSGWFLGNLALWKRSLTINLRYLGWKMRGVEEWHVADWRHSPSGPLVLVGDIWASLSLMVFLFPSPMLPKAFARRLRFLQASVPLKYIVSVRDQQRNMMGSIPAFIRLWPWASLLTSLSLKILVYLTRMRDRLSSFVMRVISLTCT